MVSFSDTTKTQLCYVRGGKSCREFVSPSRPRSEKRKSAEMSERVPDDLQLEILVRLPVKLLLRFQCVSKSWMSLISSTGFTSMHIEHNESINNYAHIFYGNLSPITDRDDKINFKYILNQFDDSFSEIQLFDFPSQTKHEFDEVLECRGLLLFTIGIVLSDVEPFFLYNPALRMSVTLPRPCFDVLYPIYHIVHGFGYDHLSNDYKVLRMMYTYIYSSRIPSISRRNV